MPTSLFTNVRRFTRLIAFFACMLSWNAYLWIRLRFSAKTRRPIVQARTQRRACVRLCRILGVSTRVENSPPDDEGYLVVSNHLGVLDAIVLASVLNATFVGKSEIVGWPLVGWVARTVGLIPVDRERRMAAAEFAQSIRARLRSGVSVIVFPEGTTSDGSRVSRFKTGAFESVVGLGGQHVLPVCISYVSVGGRPANRDDEQLFTWSDPAISMLRHCWQSIGFRKVIAEIRFGKPILVAERDRRELADVAWRAVSSLRENAWSGQERTAEPSAESIRT